MVMTKKAAPSPTSLFLNDNWHWLQCGAIDSTPEYNAPFPQRGHRPLNKASKDNDGNASESSGN